jgi:polyisoprenoid-binding protein YceI
VTPVENAVANYRIDSSASRFTVRAFAGGVLSALGHNPTIAIRDFSGIAKFDPACPDRAALEIRIRTDSLEVINDVKSSDRLEMETTMKTEILQSDQFPEITFASTSAKAEKIGEGSYRVALDGDLTLRSVTRDFLIVPRLMLTGDLLRASGDFTILQSDYFIPLVSVAGGTLRLKDELKFAFDIVSRKQS